MNKVAIDDLEVRGQRVLVRVDFNVPLDDQGKITDDSRIQATLPTINALTRREARVVLMSHLGRPKGKIVEEERLKPAGVRLSELLDRPVKILAETIGPRVEDEVNALRPGEVALLENLRFNPGEEANDPEFAAALAKLADCYVNDAFGAAHRAHASVDAITGKVAMAAAGSLLSKEMEFLGMALADPPRPFYTVLGGAKVKDKIPVIENLQEKVDGIIIGGGMAYTFQKAQGYGIGGSLYDEKSHDRSLEFLRRGKELGWELILPDDSLTIEGDLDSYTQRQYRDFPEPGIPDGWEGVDLGPRTVARFCAELSKARCVVWNGPMGVFEQEAFAYGTYAIAVTLAGLTANGCVTILGGGDTGAAAKKFGLDCFSHISTGGGASLEFLGGQELPGISALPDKV